MTTTVDQEQAFDAAVYDLPIPKLDGHKANLIQVNLGSCQLDRTDVEDLATVEDLDRAAGLGQLIELKITARVTKKGFSYTLGKDDELPSVLYGVGLRVHSLEVA